MAERLRFRPVPARRSISLVSSPRTTPIFNFHPSRHVQHPFNPLHPRHRLGIHLPPPPPPPTLPPRPPPHPPIHALPPHIHPLPHRLAKMFSQRRSTRPPRRSRRHVRRHQTPTHRSGTWKGSRGRGWDRGDGEIL